MSMARYRDETGPRKAAFGSDLGMCRVCGDQKAAHSATRLCSRHHKAWWQLTTESIGAVDFDRWLKQQVPFPTYGLCRCVVCPYPAPTPLGLCEPHANRYRAANRPGGAQLPKNWHWTEKRGEPVTVLYTDETEFHRWCVNANPIYQHGTVNLVAMAPTIAAEFKWGMYMHAQIRDRTSWQLFEVQRIANICRKRKYGSLADYDGEEWTDDDGVRPLDPRVSMIGREIIDTLRLIYYSPTDTREAGFIETDHFGQRFPQSRSTFDLTNIPQRWLRDLLWDHMAELLRSPRPPRRRGQFDALRRGIAELGAYLDVNAPDRGNTPTALGVEHAMGFVADQRFRERNGLSSIAMVRSDRKPSLVTDTTRRLVFNAVRKVMRDALETGRATQIGLSSSFIFEFPSGGPDQKRSRNPYSDNVAQALADDKNLQAFATTYDPRDRGLRDIWETIVLTGRRSGEVIKLRLDCIGRYGQLPMLWHDQTKVGNYNEGIRIPEALYERIDHRRAKTIARFEDRHGRPPTAHERSEMALFPTNVRNHAERQSLSYGFFSHSFKRWVEELDLPASVPHQARHTLATNLLRTGASLAHIRRYLGQVSDRMAEHYTKIAQSDLEDILQCVWVAGPAADHPGQPLSGDTAPVSREQATAMAIDLSRRSTPAEGGFCTFQPVVNGAACPWNLDCHNCSKFVMSGADLVYWRRKQEQWRSLAERAPDDSTADYLHQVFEPSAQAIAGLERVLAGMGLLEQALSLDLRRPQDYFHRVWSVNFPAATLAELDSGNQKAAPKRGDLVGR